MGDLVSDLQGLAKLHDAGVLNDDEFLAAKQARIARESLPSSSPQAAPALSGPREACEIRVVLVEHHSLSRSVWRYVADVTGPRGACEAARTRDFKATAGYWAFEYYPEDCEERTQAFNYIVQMLYADGWEQLPYEGEHWWNKRFQRSSHSPADGSKSPHMPDDFQIFRADDGSFSVEAPSSWVPSHRHENWIEDRWHWEGPQVREYRPNLVVFRRSPGLRNFDLEGYAKLVLKGLRRQDQPSDTETAGVPAKRLPYYVNPTTKSGAGYELVILTRQATGWQLGLNCAPDEHEVYAPLFQRFVDSFRLPSEFSDEGDEGKQSIRDWELEYRMRRGPL